MDIIEEDEKELAEFSLSFLKLSGVKLSRREIQCLNYWIRGYSISDTAQELGGLSEKTVQIFRDNIRKKFQVSSYRELFDLLLKSGLLFILLREN